MLLLAWIPMLALEDFYYENRETIRHRQVFGYAYAFFFLWNILTTWWIYFATGFGMAAAIFFNSLFMATVFAVFHRVRCRLGSTWGYVFLLSGWTAFEYLHLNWDLSWPWLTLGNGLAAFPRLVQWYEYTGVLGGSLWILLCNILMYRLIRPLLFGKATMPHHGRLIAVTGCVIGIPVLLSELIYVSYTERPAPVSIAVTQPNIDPYSEKFSRLSGAEQVGIMLKLASAVIDSTTDYLLGPETSLPYTIWEDRMKQQQDIRTIQSFLTAFPRLHLVTGASTAIAYEGKPPTRTARQFTDSPEYFDSYNTALQLHSGDSIQVYHKSKLVIGVEKIPYPAIFGYFERFAIDLGGTAGSLGVQEEPSVFVSAGGLRVAPAICYESIYGDYITRYIRKGAVFIFIITNDGWWGDTPGYRQHLQYARLRAIETRRSIARSANTGISAFISQRGDILEQTSWWNPAAIKKTMNANDKLTFYVKHGDYAGKIAAGISLLVMLVMLLIPLFRKRNP